MNTCKAIKVGGFVKHLFALGALGVAVNTWNVLIYIP